MGLNIELLNGCVNILERLAEEHNDPVLYVVLEVVRMVSGRLEVLDD